MKIVVTILDFLAVIIQLTAAVIMYKFSPIHQPKYPTQMGGVIDTVTYAIKNKGFKKGFLILTMGFVIQLFSMVLKLIFFKLNT